MKDRERKINIQRNRVTGEKGREGKYAEEGN